MTVERNRRGPFVRVVLGLVLAVLVVGGPVRPAWAHAELVVASPAPGTGQPQAPAAVVLRFTEALNVSVSGVAVVGPDGVDAGTGPTLAVIGDTHAMQRRLGLLRPGVYAVRWRSVSNLDGHALSGSYQFGVGTFAAPAELTRNDPIASEGWTGLASRLLILGGLAVWFGAGVLGGWGQLDGQVEARLNRIGRAGPGAVIIGGVLLAVSSAVRSGGSLSALPSVLWGSQNGWLRLVILAVAGAGVARWGRRGWVDDMLAASAIVAEAAAGHAAAAPHPLAATAVFALHLGAVGVWVTAIVLAVASRRDVGRVLGAVAPFAVAAGGVVAATGVAAAAFEIDRSSALADTGYGRAVVVKATILVAMVTVGLVHHRRRRAEATPRRVRRPVAVEAGMAVGALVVATLLTGFANPPREEAAAEEANQSDATLARLTSRPALSLGAATGPFTVGLTLAPPEPGEVTVLVTILGVEAGDGLRDARLVSTVDSNPSTTTSLDACGFGCFTGQVRLSAGHRRFEVEASSNRGPLRFDTNVSLPVPDGTNDMERMRLAMAQLTSAHLTETMRGAADGAAQVTDYVFEAPDRMRYDIAGGGSAVVIGADGYRRDTGSSRWASEPWPGPFGWPVSFFESFWSGATAARVIGTDTVDGTPTTVLAFVRGDLPAWFRVWVDAAGRVQRLEMIADGHLMDERYDHFDEAAPVTAPA